jgi:hypothetical protein
MSAGHISAGCAVALLLAGCSNGFETQTLDLPSDKTLLTSAEIRAVHRTSVGSGSREGKVKPAYITCAEPSPDARRHLASPSTLASVLLLATQQQASILSSLRP